MDQNQSSTPWNSTGGWMLYAWGTYPLSLLGVNLMFLLACIPVVTIPAALCGLNAVVQRYYRQRFAESVTRLFWREFLEAFLKRTVICLAAAAVPVAAVILLRDTLSMPVWLVGSAALMAFALLTMSWFMPQLVLLNLRPGHALRNALIFTCVETKANFAMMALHAVELTILLYALPTSLFLLLFLPVFHVTLVTGIVMPVLQARLVQDDPAQQ